MSYRFHPEAEVELNLSIDYYESIEPGLGYDFAIEVYDTIQRNVDFPKGMDPHRRRRSQVTREALPLRCAVQRRA